MLGNNKYFVHIFATTETLDSDNTTFTSKSFDIGEVSNEWIQYTGGTTSGDVDSQFQVSNDQLSTPDADSHWENEGSAHSIVAADPGIHKITSLGCQKARIVLAHQSGVQVLTARGVSKRI